MKREFYGKPAFSAAKRATNLSRSSRDTVGASSVMRTRRE